MKIDFDEPALATAVEALPPEAVNGLGFGAVRLDADGKVVFFSEAERRLSGFRENAMGRTFFIDIAPCMNNPAFRGRIDKALADGKLNLVFGHVGDFGDRTRALDVRVQSASGGGCWIFMKRDD